MLPTASQSSQVAASFIVAPEISPRHLEISGETPARR